MCVNQVDRAADGPKLLRAGYTSRRYVQRNLPDAIFDVLLSFEAADKVDRELLRFRGYCARRLVPEGDCAHGRNWDIGEEFRGNVRIAGFRGYFAPLGRLGVQLLQAALTELSVLRGQILGRRDGRDRDDRKKLCPLGSEEAAQKLAPEGRRRQGVQQATIRRGQVDGAEEGGNLLGVACVICVATVETKEGTNRKCRITSPPMAERISFSTFWRK